MKKFGLIGHPIAHSLSPALFKAAYNGRYQYDLIEGEEFEKSYINQGFEKDRDIEETLSLGWELMKILPRSELKRIRTEYIDKYWGEA